MKLRSSAAVKITAAILSVLLLLCAVLSVLLWIVAESLDFATSSYVYLADEVKRNLVEDHLKDVWRTYRRGDDPVDVYVNTNLVFRIRDENGDILVESADADFMPQLSYSISAAYDRLIREGEEIPPELPETTETSVLADASEADVTYTLVEEGIYIGGGEVDMAIADTTVPYAAGKGPEYETVVCTLEGDVLPILTYTDRYLVILTALNIYYEIYRALPFAALGFLLLWIVCLCVLLRSVGWHRGEDAPRLGWFEWIPFDLLCFGIVLFAALHDYIFWRDDVTTIVLTLAFTLADVLILTLFLCTTAVRLKTHSLLKTTLVWYVLVLAWRALCWLWRGICRVCSVTFGALGVAFGSIPLVWKTALCILLNAFVDVCACVLMHRSPGSILLFFLIKNVVLGVAILFCAVLMRRIQAVGERLAAGDLNAKIDARYMFGDFRQFSENLNRLGEGMSAAVDERMKSERLRTELITNVSHDIKTPLTSIVNYADLMQKEHVTEEPLAGYIEVLARQAARLKKLTEDLVEASKAATGNITVQPDVLDVSMMLGQTAGEYDEKLRSAKLDLILRQPPEPVNIIADGRLLWRVFDNLMNNIVKYAMPGTRVYLTLRTDGGEAEILFRNIARDEVSMASDELLERFTRGDASRSTEGSGLGLSIANSLTELQGGTLQLTVDGDLFKVAIRFPLGE